MFELEVIEDPVGGSIQMVAVIIRSLSMLILMLCVTTAQADTKQDSADATASAEVQPQKVKKSNPNTRVCKRVRPTGSHIRQRVCLKQRQWDEMREDAQRTTRNSTSAAVAQD